MEWLGAAHMFRCSNQIVFRCSGWSNVSVPCSVALLGDGWTGCTAQRWKELEIGRKATPKVSEGMSCTVEHGCEVALPSDDINVKLFST